MAIIATGSKTIIDLSDGKSLSVYLGANQPRTQIHDVNASTYSPDWTTTAGKLTVIAGKTGYTPESKYCLVTAATDASGKTYVCVTVGADGYENSIKAYQAIYGGYVG